MIYIGENPWNKATSAEKIAYCEELLQDSKQGRETRDMEWYLNYSFIEGNHYLSYNTVSNSLERPAPKKTEVRLVVNKTRASVRAIQNYATRSQPKWEVIPGDIDEDTIKDARRTGKVLDYVYRRLHLEQTIASIVDSGLNTSVAWVEIDWDDKAEGGLGQVRIRHHDSFDIFADRRGRVYAGKYVGRFIAKTVDRTIAEIKYDKKYDYKEKGKFCREDVKPDDEIAESPIKARILRKEMGPGEDKIKRAIVKEFSLWDEEKNEKGGNITLFTYAGGKVLRETQLAEKEFTLYLFQIPMNPNKLYQRSWTADAIPLNKALDRNLSQKVMYINKALVYRIVAEKGHGVNVVTNEMGEVVEISPGRKFEQMAMAPLPSTLDSLSNELSTHMEDILGAHDAALGRLPAGARSGKTIEALQAADSNNLAGITQSLESFLAIIGEKVLNLIAKKYVTSRITKIAEPESDGQEYVRVIGENAPDEAKREDALVIKEENELIVKIGSWLGHTREAQRETLLQLAEAGLLPAEEVLRQFEFPNVEELSSKARDQRLEQHTMDAEIAGRQQTEAGGKVQSAQAQKLVAMADKENLQMMNGENLPSTEGAPQEHTQAHLDFMASKTFQDNADETLMEIFTAHVQGEMQQNGLVPQGQ